MGCFASKETTAISSPATQSDGHVSIAGDASSKLANVEHVKQKQGQQSAPLPGPAGPGSPAVGPVIADRARLEINQANRQSHDANASNPFKEAPVMQRVKGILQDLTVISTEGPDACAEAVNLLHSRLEGVACVSLSACTTRPGVSVLVAAQGLGADVLLQQQQLVCSGSQWSAGSFAGKAEPLQVMYQTVVSDEQAAALPQDWAQQYHTVGFKTFMAVPVTSHGSLMGVLNFASSQASAFHEYWWEPVLSIVCTGLIPMLRNQLVSSLCELMATLDSTTNMSHFVITLLHGACSLLESYTNLSLGLRLGLLSPDGQQALLLQVKGAGGSSGSSNRSRNPAEQPGSAARQTPSVALLGSPGAAGDSGQIDGDMKVVCIAARNTLMLDALNRGVARFVRNTAAYLEGVSEPSHDVFVDEDDVVSSIVVAPLLVAGTPYGALYITHNMPTTDNTAMSKRKAAVMALGGLLQRLLVHHPLGQSSKAWEDALAQAKGRSSSGRLAPATPRLPDAGESGTYVWGPASSAEQAQSPSGVSSVASAGTSGFRLQQSAPARPMREPVATSSIVEMLRQQVQRSNDKQRDMEYVKELQLHKLLGKGGFGSVFAGTWKGSSAAIKVMYVQQHERQLMKNAMEMAVLTTIRHPNIVRVYACLTDMVEEGVPGAAPGLNHAQRRFRVAKDAADSASLCNIVVMEICDRGNLRQAMRQGLLHKRTNNKGLVVDMRLLITVLLEVARSIQHLHSLQLIHCDVKAENVLLQSNDASSIGFTCKLGDFGLVKMLLDKYYVTNRSGSGTVTHLAPELFEAGSKVTSAVDAYAFGVMMYELYSCQRPFAGLPAESIVKRVFRQQGRPQFPPGTPPGYQQLAESCWSQCKDDRPTFDSIVQQLQVLLDAAGGPFEYGRSHTDVPDEQRVQGVQVPDTQT